MKALGAKALPPSKVSKVALRLWEGSGTVEDVETEKKIEIFL